MDCKETNEDEIFEKAIAKIQTKIKSFTSDILDDIGSCFTEFRQFSRQRQDKYIQTINQQKQVVEKMGKFIEFAKSCETMFMKKANNNPKEGKLQDEDQNQEHFQQIGPEIFSLKERQKQADLNGQNYRPNTKKQNLVRDNQKTWIKKQVEPILVEDSPLDEGLSIVEEEQSSEKRGKDDDIEQEKQPQKFKYPLRCSAKHSLVRAQYKPNRTRISYVSYEFSESNVYTEKQVQKLDEYDLRIVECINVNNTTMCSKVLKSLCQLNWHNIVSIVLYDNEIVDIRAIKHLDLKKIVELDVSGNPLNQESVVFLAQQPFPSLIYFVLSFEKENADEYWEIMLSNKFLNCPKIEQIQIEKSDYVTKETKNKIQICIKQLENQQKEKNRSIKSKNDLRYEAQIKRDSSNKDEFLSDEHQHPDTSINIIWFSSRQDLSRVQQKLEKQAWQNFRKKMGLKITPLKKIDRKKFKNQLKKMPKANPISSSQETIKKRKLIQKRKNQHRDHQALSEDEENKLYLL